MYGFITHTFNMVKGTCPHGCEYCYMSKRGKLNPPRFDRKELKSDLGSGNTIFVGSSCDMWAEEIPTDWIAWTLLHCQKHWNNRYFFQSKNPSRFLEFVTNCINFDNLVREVTFCTTIETNRIYTQMGNTPSPKVRAIFMEGLSKVFPTHLTIEPIMDFDIDKLLYLALTCNPIQVNIGADSKGCKLPEPSAEKVKELIKELKKFTKVYEKSNLKRLLNRGMPQDYSFEVGV